MTQTLESQWDRLPLTVDALVPTVALRYHLGRVHIGTPAAEVERETRDAIAAVRSNPGWTADIVAETIAAALWLHEENRAEYHAVMTGRL